MKSSRKEENGPPQDHLPAPRKQNALRIQESAQALALVVEQGAHVYFGACRRLAQLLNRKDR